MALKVALLSWTFSTLHEDIKYDQELDYDFSKSDKPLPGEANQPVIAEAVAKIKMCLSTSIDSMFKFGTSQIQNFSNFLHIATLSYDTHVQSGGQTGIVVLVKFYLMPTGTKDDPSQIHTAYKVSLDIEQMADTSIDPHSERAYDIGISNKNVTNLCKLLDKSFELNGQIESIPLIKRGRTNKPHFLVSSDDRVLEYDFDDILFHRESEYQDVKIVSSPSLGNLLLLDNLQNLADVDLDYTNALMDRDNVSYKDKEILILGGGDGGLLYELLKEDVKFVTMAEIDPVVIEACREFIRPCGEVLKELDGPRHKIIIDDCIKVLRQSIKSGKKYDVIFNDLTDIPVGKREESHTAFQPDLKQQDNPWGFIEAIFNLSLDCLANYGVYLNHASGWGNKDAISAYEQFLQKSKVKVEFRHRLACVPSFMEIWVFYTVWKKQDSRPKLFTKHGIPISS